MKLHLPPSLHGALLVCIAAACSLTCADAATMHADVSIITYADFGQNKGRYAAGNVNALLSHIREQEGGITINYTDGRDSVTLTTPMIDFNCVPNTGSGVAMGYSWIATCAHDVYGFSRDSVFTRFTLPSGHSIQYYGIEYYSGSETVFRHVSTTDFKMTRMSKLITDVSGTMPYGSADGDYSSIASLSGQYLYRAGGGTMYRAYHDGSRDYLCYAYTFTVGGVDTLYSVGYDAATGNVMTTVAWDRSPAGAGINSPLPYDADAGDSGSGAWAWNENTGRYEFISSHHGSGGNKSYGRSNTEWAVETMASHDVALSMQEGQTTLCLNKVDTQGITQTCNGGAGVSGTIYSGAVTDAAGNEIARFNGVQTGINLWKDLSALKDTQTWYTYTNAYLNARERLASGITLTYADIYNNSNLVISSSTEETCYLVLNDTVDLGIGYVLFTPGEGTESANFVVRSEGDEGNLFNSAGYVVEKGASVHLQLTNPESYMREWRKIGEGDLYIEGSGNNGIFLNVGGSGTTYLNREDGYAAYNVLVNNGSTIVISDIGQIARDLTFGNKGGVLDMNGQSMIWDNSLVAESDGFTINALDEHALITNTAGQKVTLTWTQGGEQTWLGSFADSENGALEFVYDGGDGARLTMNSIHTDLTHHREESGMRVVSGTLALQGTVTEHAMGTLTGTNTLRYVNEDDWHYADAAANITIESGGSFELGSHARLTGDVTVESGGVYVMREGVKHRMEYIEGGEVLENTDAIRDFFGHKGNVSLASGAELQVAFSEGTDSTLVYDYDISGAGHVSIAAQDGILRLGGNNSFSGTKTIISGGLFAASNAALGDVTDHKWIIGEQGWLASADFTEENKGLIFDYIDSSSTGVLALSSDMRAEVDLSNYTGLIIGAADGCSVHYGTADASLTAVNGAWTLGGGGGELCVDFKLSGEYDLVLGNAYGKGTVILTNTRNDFTGNVVFKGGVTLSYEPGTLGGSVIDLAYSNRVLLHGAGLGNVAETSSGALLVDKLGDAAIDLSAHRQLALGAQQDATYSGEIVLAEGEAYRFGGGTGTLTVTSALDTQRNIVIDGQTYSGGTTVLTHLPEVTGEVVVMGYDAGQTDAATGDATLRLVAENSLVNAASVTAKDGGIIDMAGYGQALGDLTLGAGGSLIDSSEAGSTLTLNGTASLQGRVVVSTIVKTGDENITLGGENAYNVFEVQGGRVTLASDTAMDADSEFILRSGSTLDMGSKSATASYTASGHLVLDGGCVENFGTLSGSVEVRQDSTASAGNAASSSISGELQVVEGASFSLDASSLSLSTLSGSGHVTIESTNTAVGNHHTITNASGFSGHLTLKGDGVGVGDNGSGFKLANYLSFGTGTVTLDGVAFYLGSVNDEDTLVQAMLDVGSGGAVLNGSSGSTYYFTGLKGDGAFYTCLGGGGKAWFRGDVSGFSGTIGSNVARDTEFTFYFGGDGVNYHSLTGNSSEGAVNIFSEGAQLRSYASAPGGSGMTYEFRYTDEVVLNATVCDYANVRQTGKGTLVINSVNTSAGSLYIHASGSVRLEDGGVWTGSLTGEGTLINANTTETGVIIASSTDFEGSLKLMAGSSLTLGSDELETYSLTPYVSLNVFGDGSSARGAELNVSSLELNGGTLSFSGNALMGCEGAALILTQGVVSEGEILQYIDSQYIYLYDTTALAAGEYLLASGDWSVVADKSFSISGLQEYFSTTDSYVTADADGLHLSLSYVDGVKIWLASADENEWNSSSFGSNTVGTGATDNVYFTDLAQHRRVNITEEVEAQTLVFNSTATDYVLSSENGSTLAAGGLQMQGSCIVELGSGVSLSGATTIATGNELRVTNFSIFGSEATVSGAGMLTVDAGEASGTLAADLSGLSTLRLISGRYETQTALGATSVVVEGGQLYLSGETSHSNTITAGGAGWANAAGDNSAAALRLENGVTLSGALSLSSDATIAVTGTGATIAGRLNTGDYTLTKTGSASLTLSNSNVVGNLSIAEGTLLVDATLASLSTLTLGEGTTVQVGYGKGLTADSICMQDASRLELRNGAGDTSVVNSAIELSGDVTIAGSLYGNNTEVQGSISGNGTLKLETTGGNSWLISSTMADAEGGSLAVSSNSNVTLSGENSYTGGTTVLGNTLTTSNELALGGGALTVNAGASVVLDASLHLSTLSGDSGASVNTNAQLLLLGNGSATYSGNLSGGGVLVKMGEGRQELGGSIELAGMTVAGGTLALNGATATLTGAFAVQEGTSLALCDTSLRLARTLTSSGSILMDGGVNFVLNTDFGGYDAETKTYTLISGGSIDYGSADIAFTLGSMSSADMDAASYTISRGTDALSITINEFMRELNWLGNESSAWSPTAGSGNWQTASGAATGFISYDYVNFGSEGTRRVVVADGGVQASSVSITAAGYEFSGGSIVSVGDMEIALGASASFEQAVSVGGDLSIAGSANFAQETTVEGSLSVSGNATFAGGLSFDGPLAVDAGGSLTALLASQTFSQAVSVGENASLTLTGTMQIFSGAVTLESGSSLVVDTTSNVRSQFSSELRLNGDATIGYTCTAGGNADLLVANKLTGNGHTITKTGAGLLWLAPTSLSDVSFVVAEGRLRVGGSSGSVIPRGINSITLRTGTELSFTADTSSFATDLSLEGGSTIDLRGTNGGAETYTFTGQMALNAAEDASHVTVTPVNSTRTLNIDGKVTGDGGLTLGGTGALTISLNNAANDFTGGILTSRAATINLASATAAGTGELALNHASAIVNLSGNDDGTYGRMANNISGTGQLNISSGRVDLSGTNTFSGGMTVGAGAALRLTSASAAGAGAIALGDSTASLLYAGSETGTFSRMSNAISGEGSVVVESGMLEFVNSSLDHAGGTTVMDGASLLLTSSTLAGALVVEEGGSATLAGQMNLAAPISLAGSLTLAEGLCMVLDADYSGYDAESSTYTIISGGSVSYTQGLDFVVGSIHTADLGENNFTLNVGDGSLSFTLKNLDALGAAVTWNGADGSAVWSNASDTMNWTKGADAIDTAFNSLDRVTFGSTGQTGVTVAEEGVKVSTMDVTAAGYEFTGGSITSRGDMNIVSGASASFAQAVEVDGNLTVAGSASFDDLVLGGTLTASGDLTLNGEADIASASITRSLTVGDGGDVSVAALTSNKFSGAVSVGEGAGLSLTSSNNQSFAGKVTLARDSRLEIAAGSGRSSFSAGVELTGDATLGYSQGAGLLVSCALKGNGYTLTKVGTGLLWLDSSSASFSLQNVSFRVEEGELRIGGTSSKDIPTGISSVTLNAGSQLSLTSRTSSFATDLSLEGGSTIDLRGTNGGTETYTFTGEIALNAVENASRVTVTPVDSTRTLNLNGKVTGDGGLTLGGTGALTITLNNADNDFTGGISTSRAATINLASATAAGTGELALNNASAVVNVTGNTDGTYGQMGNRLSGSGQLNIVSGQVALSTGGSVGAASVQAGASLQLSGALTVADVVTLGSKSSLARSRSVQTAGGLENAEVTRDAITSVEGARGVLSSAAVSVSAAEYTISGLDVLDSRLMLDSTSLNLQDVVLASGCMVSGLSADVSSMAMQDVTLALSGDVYTLVDGAIYGSAWAGRTVGVYSVETFNNVKLAGTMMMDVSAVPAAVSAAGSVADVIAFDFGSDSGVVLDGFQLSMDGSSYVAATAGTSAYIFGTASENIPEPASALLALLGISGLSLRRRRR